VTKRLTVVECFYSLQGEGARAGTPNVFIRLAGCNLLCTVESAGFNCDTDWSKGETHTVDSLLCLARTVWDQGGGPAWDSMRPVIFTGGEPLLQLDQLTVQRFAEDGWAVCVETNGTIEPPPGIYWLSVSPKPQAEVKVKRANEVRCVVREGQEPDARGIDARYQFVSPAAVTPSMEAVRDPVRFKPGPDDLLGTRALAWAIEWVKGHPDWRLSVQQHKLWGVR